MSLKAKFLVNDLSWQDIDNMVKTNVLKQPFIFDPTRLKILTISYYDFDGVLHQDGKMIVLDAAADYVILAFKKLFKQKFYLSKIKLMNEYKGDDNLSLKDNNTSSFNQRYITGSASSLSIHAYGLAIDINPIQNPYISFDYNNGTAQYYPIEGAKYANRLENRPEKPNREGLAEGIKNIFYQYGFNIWGGDWDNPIDYQHFQTSRILAELLVIMNADDAKEFFKIHVEYLSNHERELAIYMKNNGYPDLKSSYNADKPGFIKQAKSFLYQSK